MKYSTQQWQEFFKEQKNSDLSIAAFCRDKNIKVKRFYNNRSNHLKKTQTSAFILAKKPAAKPSNLECPNVTLLCGDGQLHIPTTVSPVWLAQLLNALA
tara:strand:- start:638 stop:934 length:297 start_codon:yes stop_codon:yes gene_type:complete